MIRECLFFTCKLNCLEKNSQVTAYQLIRSYLCIYKVLDMYLLDTDVQTEEQEQEEMDIILSPVLAVKFQTYNIQRHTHCSWLSFCSTKSTGVKSVKWNFRMYRQPCPSEHGEGQVSHECIQMAS